MALLEFIFGSFWRFAGTAVLMVVVAICINSHIEVIQKAGIKKKRTIQIMQRPERTIIWVEHPTDEDVKSVLMNKSLEINPEERCEADTEGDWEF